MYLGIDLKEKVRLGVYDAGPGSMIVIMRYYSARN